MQETIVMPQHEADTKDPIESTLRGIAQNIIVFVFGLLPIFFLPVSFLPFDYVKTVLVIGAVMLAVIFYSLSVLRSGTVRFTAPLALGALWLVVIVAAVSAGLSGDMHDAFFGDDLGIHTSVFIALLAIVASTMLIIAPTKTSIMRLFILLLGSGFVLALFHLLRIVFGAGFLSLNTFGDLVSTPLGNWNDLGLFFGLSILLSLVALEQLPLTKWGRVLFSSVVGVSLVMLAIVNFFAVWIVLALVSLMVLMYTLTKDRFSEKTLTLEGKKASVSLQSVIVSVAVFIVSIVFLIGGGAVGTLVSKMTGISYLEVRPSLQATLDIARHVYHENALLGVGPNKFMDAWRLYKDPSINQTVFWATDFRGGSGYATTQFITTGVLGGILWLVFFALFLATGLRMLFKAPQADRFWYFIGSSSFVAAVFLWGMSFIYVPGVTSLLLASMFTGLTLAVYATLVPLKTFTISIGASKRGGFLLIGAVMVVIVLATSGLYLVGRHYSGVYLFTSAVSNLRAGSDISSAETGVASAYSLLQNDSFALELASYQLAKINTYAAVTTELTDQQQQDLQSSIQNGINAAQVAVGQDPTDPLNWSMLGSIMSVLAEAKVEGAKDRALEAFEKARTYDPSNPLYVLLEAQLSSRTGDLAGARAKAQEAVTMKQNYTDAILFLTQLDVAEGKTDDAIGKTRAVISLEPNNPARYYQLGVLYSSQSKFDEAIAAFSRAIDLDTNYANARYFLGIALAQKGDAQGAIAQLQKVLELNPGNADVSALIAQLQANGKLPQQSAPAGQVTEPTGVTTVDNTVTASENPDTPLISPVNTPAESDTASSAEEAQ
jgi:tetratricopeptide (TPR) repeat protein